MAVNEHWTAPHIKLDEESNEYIGYDEAGLEHTRSCHYFVVKERLISYAAELSHTEEVAKLKKELARKNQVLKGISSGAYGYTMMCNVAREVLNEFR